MIIKEEKNGFIATSLIYSFFLVFIAMLALLLRIFITNKTILDRFNDDIVNTLDSRTFTVSVTSSNANIQNGIILTNLIANGSFNNDCAFWQINGRREEYTCNGIYLGLSSIKKNNSVKLNQNIYLNANNLYYYSIKYSNENNSTSKTYIGEIKNGYIESKNTFGTWKKDSQIFATDKTGNKTFYLGVGYDNKSTIFADVLLLDLTSNFHSGYEPDKKWLDENIDYFNGTISFFKKSNIKREDTIRILMIPYVGYNNYILNCLSGNNTFSKSISKEKINGVDYQVLTLSSIKDDVKCSVEWSRL